MPVTRIIIIQTSRVGFENCKREIEEAGIVPKDCYYMTQYSNMASRLIVPGEMQLLITGNFDGSQQEADAFVWDMKEKNPSLTCANFSERPVRGEPYDLTILRNCKSGFCCFLILEMRKFLLKLYAP